MKYSSFTFNLLLFATSCACAIKSVSPHFCDKQQSCITNAQSNFAADGCTIYGKNGSIVSISEFLDLFCFLFSKSLQELQRWVTLCAPLITSEFRTMMRKKLTNSQLITMSGNVRICLTKFPHRCVTWNQDICTLTTGKTGGFLRSKTSMRWLFHIGQAF